jgi:hypothetical protein
VVEIVTVNLLFGFGNTCLPKLPGDWVVIERPGHFVVALSPTDKLYLVSREKLYAINDLGVSLRIPELLEEDRRQLQLPIKKANQ